MGIVGFILGTILGSFVKALADRSLTNKSFWGRSYCPKCKSKLHWYDLTPIVSYILLRGKCRYCHKKISVEYLVVEVVMGLLIGFLFWQSLGSVQVTGYRLQFQDILLLLNLIFKAFFISILAVLFITDLKKMFIPDRIVVPAIVISVIYLAAITIYKVGYLYYYLSQTRVGQLLLPPYSDYFQNHALQTAQPFWGGVAAALVIGGFFYLLIIMTKGKGMGGGDVKLGAFIGLGLGFPNSIVALILSFISGAVFSLVLIFLGKKHFGQVIPFGPFLVLGSLIALFWGQRIIEAYLQLGY